MNDYEPRLAADSRTSSWLDRAARYAAPATVLVLFVVLLVGRSGHADAYTLSGHMWPNGSAVVISLQLGSNGQGTLMDGSANFDVVAQQAANLWNNYLGSDVRMITTLNGSGPGISNDGMNSAFFSDTNFGRGFGSAIAVTTTTFRTDLNLISAADVVFNTAFQFDSYRGTELVSVYDLRRVAIHEFGHLLGLSHSASPSAIMYAFAGTGTFVDVMQQDDIDGLQAIYGVPSPSPTPTPTPTPIPLGGQTLIGAIAHVYSSPGEPVGRGGEANIDTSRIYSGADYRREVESGTGRTLHRFVFAKNGVAGTGEWVFTFAAPAGQNLANGPDTASASVSFEGMSSSAVAGQLILSGVTYAGGVGSNLVSIAADFRLTQSSVSGAPQFLAGQLRFNVPSIPLPAARIVNLSTRVMVGIDAARAIAGFVFRDPTGVGKQALVRVIGPGLTPRGVTGVLANPVANLYAGSTNILSNDNWADGLAVPSQAPVVQLGLEPTATTESVMLNRFSDGAYTTIVSGSASGVGGAPADVTGVALVEVYDLEIGSAASLINVSTRGQVGTGGNVMIGGFVIQGPGLKKVIVRAIGPSLTALGVAGALQNPKLDLYSGSTIVATNDDYAQNSTADQAAIAGKNLVPGDPRESAIYMVLAPGAYTAIVSGVGGATGVGLVEVYDAD